jgi:predicted RNase H-like nuclease (RuvC/YqgF family)
VRRLKMSVNRTVCDALEAMRKAYDTRNFSYLPGLIEECQNMVNRMESALWDQNDLEYLHKEKKKLKKQIKKLEEKVEELEDED